MGSWKGRGNQYIEFVRVLYCKLLTKGKQLQAFPLEAVPGTKSWLQRWEARVLPLCHRGPPFHLQSMGIFLYYLTGGKKCHIVTHKLLMTDQMSQE